MSAILNALAPLGIEHIDMPATPSHVWAAMKARASQVAAE
jgi:carbon-monoxide dehydrogenase large subunit